MDNNFEFVCWDIETTGLSKDSNEITQIGAVRVQNKKVVDRFCCYIKIDGTVPPHITELTGITKEVLDTQGLNLEDVLQQFKDFCKQSLLVSHNGKRFDTPFLKVACKKVGLSMSNRHLDTFLLAKKVTGQNSGNKLGELAARFDCVIENAHRADVDAEMLAYVALELFNLSSRDKMLDCVFDF